MMAANTGPGTEAFCRRQNRTCQAKTVAALVGTGTGAAITGSKVYALLKKAGVAKAGVWGFVVGGALVVAGLVITAAERAQCNQAFEKCFEKSEVEKVNAGRAARS